MEIWTDEMTGLVVSTAISILLQATLHLHYHTLVHLPDTFST